MDITKKFTNWIDSKGRRPGVLTGMASCGIAIFMFWVVSYISQVLHGKYNPLSQTISSLEVGPGSMWEKAGLFVAGILAIAFTSGLYMYVKPPRARTFLTGIFFLLLVDSLISVLAFVPPDFPGVLHTVLSIIIFCSFPLACFFQLAQYKKQGWRKIYIYTLVTGVAAIGFNLFLYLSPDNLHGLAERLGVLNGMAWHGVMGVYIIYHVRKAGYRTSHSQAPMKPVRK